MPVIFNHAIGCFTCDLWLLVYVLPIPPFLTAYENGSKRNARTRNTHKSSKHPWNRNNLLGIGTACNTQFGPGVVVGVQYATYLISFINHGVKKLTKTDTNLDEIIPENITVEVGNRFGSGKVAAEDFTAVERCKRDRTARRTLDRQHNDPAACRQVVEIEIPVDDFFHKIVMLQGPAAGAGTKHQQPQNSAMKTG